MYVARMHGLLGHDKTAAFIGANVGDKRDCVLCQHENAPTVDNEWIVYEALDASRRKRHDDGRS